MSLKTFTLTLRTNISFELTSCLIFMDLCIVVWLSRNTNKMQLCNRIYYSKVYWRLNVFRTAHRSSSGALNCICSLWFIYTCCDRPLSSLGGKKSCYCQTGHGWQCNAKQKQATDDNVMRNRNRPRMTM